MRALVSLALTCCFGTAAAQEITLEEMKVEGLFVSPLELPSSKSIDQLVDRFRLKDEKANELELRNANKSSLTTLLELTRYSPISLGASDAKVDSFLSENYMRADLNPRETKSIFERRNR